jgi:preprotein translocase subunit SecG
MILVAFHVMVGIFLILVVLLQTGKGASLGVAFGGSSDTMFGARGPGSFLSKMTTVVAVVFILTSLALATPYFARRQGGSVIREQAAPVSTPAQSESPGKSGPPAPSGAAPAEKK